MRFNVPKKLSDDILTTIIITREKKLIPSRKEWCRCFIFSEQPNPSTHTHIHTEKEEKEEEKNVVPKLIRY